MWPGWLHCGSILPSEPSWIYKTSFNVMGIVVQFFVFGFLFSWE